MKKAKVFISYCQQPKANEAWVQELAKRLRSVGYDTVVDKENDPAGQSVHEWNSDNAEKSDLVLMIGTPKYAEKASQKGFIAHEVTVISRRLTTRDKDDHGIFFLVREGESDKVTPPVIQQAGLKRHDFTDDKQFEARLKDLLSGMEAVLERRTGRAKRFATGQYGIILMADVVDFTHYRWDEQVRIMQRMTDFVEQKQEAADDASILTMNLLDGVAVIWKDVTAFDEACQTALELIDHMAKSGPPITITVGLHIGSYSKSLGAAPMYFGNALNDCRRLCQVGDHMHVMLSENFWVDWCKHSNSALQQKVTPGFQDQPIQVYATQGDAGKVRLLRNEHDEGRVPKTLFMRDLAGRLLTGFIGTIADEVNRWLHRNYDVTAKKQNLRVTLWAPNPAQTNQLTATEYRYPKNGDAPGPASKTVYDLQGEGEPPAGRAFRKPDDVFVLHKLPKATPGDLVRYKKAMPDTRPETVEHFSRWARSFLCFAFPGPNGSIEPYGVVCIDLEDPLTKAEKTDLESLARELREAFAELLAVAWRCRT